LEWLFDTTPIFFPILASCGAVISHSSNLDMSGSFFKRLGRPLLFLLLVIQFAVPLSAKPYPKPKCKNPIVRKEW
jgi:hypothetical protein